MAQFIYYAKCGTCRKALKWLDENGISYEKRDIKTEPPTREELGTFYEKSGLDIKRFFNTSGGLYRELNLKERLPQMSVEEKLDLLATDGMLVKRPIYVDGDLVLVGFKEVEWEVLR